MSSDGVGIFEVQRALVGNPCLHNRGDGFGVYGYGNTYRYVTIRNSTAVGTGRQEVAVTRADP
jgi:hypothetical protein